MYEEQLAQIAQQQFNMESTSLAMDNMRNSMATFDAMKTANKELKKQYGKVDIDKIEVCRICSICTHSNNSVEPAIRYGGFARADE